MAMAETTAATATPSLRAWQVYSMAAIYLTIGLVIGYVLRASQSHSSRAGSAAVAAASQPKSGLSANANAPTLEQMKEVADQRTSPLLEKLKSDPNNVALLMQLGSIYHSSHQFNQAATYYGRAVQADPKNFDARTKLAISLYRSGDVDAAIAQLDRTLRADPGDANALFNLGMIRWQGKQDGAGALAAWQQLLKLNPQLSDDRKAEVQRLITGVQASVGKPNPNQGARNHDRP
jgi:cytochrome c-type biogenesis protein CcmH/NrfG